MLRTISREYFLSEFDLPEDDVEELVQEAKTTITNDLQRLGTAFAENHETPRLKEIAHAFKGNLLNMGLAAQARKAFELEMLLSQKREQAQQHFLSLQEELKDF